MPFDQDRVQTPCRVNCSLTTAEFDRLHQEMIALNVGRHAILRLALQRYLGLKETAIEDAKEFSEQFRKTRTPT